MIRSTMKTRRQAMRMLGIASAAIAASPILARTTLAGAGDSQAGVPPKPGDDFYRFVNMRDIDAMVIPQGRWDYGQFDVAAARVTTQIEELVRAAARHIKPRLPEEGRVAIAYRALLDEAAIARRGVPALRRSLAQIMAASTHDALAVLMAHPLSSSLVAFNIFPAQGVWMVHLDNQNHNQPALGLPAQAYAGEDARSAAMREAYLRCITALFGLAGIADGARRAADILAIETRIAANLWSLDRRRDRRANLHIMTVTELEAYASGLPWRAMLKARGIGGVDRVNLGTDSSIAAQARLYAETPLDTWRSWLAYSWIRNAVDALPAPFRDAHWALTAATSAREAPRPSRDAEAIRMIGRRLPMEVGRLYVDAHVPTGTRETVATMLDYLKRAMDERLRAADWLDTASKAEALAKLDAMGLKAAYPKTWPAWQGDALRADDAFGNLDRLVQRDWALQRARLNDPAARAELWYQAPQFVNASYSVLLNTIEVPAAMLQPPFFAPDRDPAANFGAIGAIVGHEIGHGFDDQGLLYDSKGILRDWMSKGSQAAFADRAERLVGQYEGFEPLPGLKLNGRRTLGENIADLAGVSLALRALQLHRADHPGSALDDRAALREFFTGWARAWTYKAPDDAIRHIVANSYHVPAPFRVNGAVRNLDGWYDAFDVRPGGALYLAPGERVRLW